MPLAVVDTNVSRVLSRIYALKGEASRNAGRLKALAQVLLPTGKAGDWNQAMMDLGATVCLPRGPRCGECPWRRACQARKAGLQDRIPGLPVRRRPVPVRLDCVLCERGGKVLVEKRTAGLLAGHWGLPSPRRSGPGHGPSTHHSVPVTLSFEASAARSPAESSAGPEGGPGPLSGIRFWRKALEQDRSSPILESGEAEAVPAVERGAHGGGAGVEEREGVPAVQGADNAGSR